MSVNYGRIIMGIALALSGCGQHRDKPSESVVFNPEEYIKASCEYSIDAGDDLKVRKSSSPVVQGYFGKRYNKDWLRNVGHTSMRDTLKYVETTGTQVYFSNAISQRSCKNFSFASVMPPDIERDWKQADYRGEKNEFLAGLYLIKGTREHESLQSKSAIVVREDANRWTLVHEFMHHNFKSQAILRGYDDALVQNGALALAREMDRIVKDPKMENHEKIKMVTPLFLEFLDRADQLVIQYSFEEIAVEAMLQDKYDSGELGYVPAESYRNATWYIQHSKENARKIYRSLDGLYETLRTLAQFPDGVYPEFSLLEKHEKLKKKRLAQLDAMLDARELKKFSSFESASIMGSVPCGEAVQIEETLGQLTNAIYQIGR